MAIPDERLSALSSEAASLLNLAKQYREKMNALPIDDPTRKELEGVIKDLLDKVDSLSSAVQKNVARY